MKMIVSNCGVVDNLLSEEVRNILGSNKELVELYNKRKLDTEIVLENFWGSSFNYIGKGIKSISGINELYRYIRNLSGRRGNELGYMAVEECEDGRVMIYIHNLEEILLYVNTNEGTLVIEKGSLDLSGKGEELISVLSDCFSGLDVVVPVHLLEYWVVDSNSCDEKKGTCYVGYSEAVKKNRGNSLERYVDGEYVVAYVEVV